jgi:5'-nucleotidase / UDP-sugar diphosphatase
VKSRKKASNPAGITRYISLLAVLALANSRYLIGLFILTSAAFTEARPRTVSAAFFGDVYRLSKDTEGLGGFAGQKALFDELDPDTLRLCVGDLLYPNTLSKKQDGGRHRIDLLNDFNLTTCALGNHDLDGGEENTLARISESNFPWLAANAIDNDGNYYTGDQQLLIFERNGIKIAVFGLMSEETPRLVIMANNITFTPIVPTARRMVEEARQQGAQIIIALTHMEPHEDKYLAKKVKGINAIFGGHDHSKIAEHIGNTLLIKSGQEAQWLAKVMFEEKKYGTFSASYEFIKNQDIKENPEVLKKVKKYQQAQDALNGSNQTIAIIDQDYDTLEDNLRSGNSAFATMIAASLQEKGSADVGFLFGGCIRNKHVYKKGDAFTYSDASKELPFGDKFSVIEASGEMLIEALENGVSKMPANYGSFPQLSDMTYDFNENQPAGNRIIAGSVFIQGQPLDLNRKYKVATSNVIVEGRVGYDMFKKAKVLFPPSQDFLLVDIFADYMENNPSMKLASEEDNSPSTFSQESCRTLVPTCPVKLPFFAELKNDAENFSPSPQISCL